MERMSSLPRQAPVRQHLHHATSQSRGFRNFAYCRCRFRGPSFDALVEPVRRWLIFFDQEAGTMRFMVIVKANKESEAGELPGQEMLAEMGKFNEELAKAGVLLAADG